MTPAPKLESLQREIAARVRTVIKRDFVHLSPGPGQSILVDTELRIDRFAMTAWSVKLLVEGAWFEISWKPTGTSRNSNRSHACYEWQYKALLILRRYLILDELADV